MKLKNELIDYSHSVISGNIIACQKHKWACKRFLDDLEREGTKDFPYIFDSKRAGENPPRGKRINNDGGFLNWMRLFKHTEGILAGKYIEPHIIQKFIFGNVYGWVNQDTDKRRFTKAYWQVARKNAKSQSLACVGKYETMVQLNRNGNKEKAQVYIGATKSEQSKIVYDLAVDMLDNCPELKGKYKVAYGRIHHLKTRSIFKPLSEEDKKTGDGLNIQCAIIDEYHAHETSEIYDILDSGMGARGEPLLIIITTAGLDLDNPCYTVEYNLVSKLLDPNNPVKLEFYFAMVNELETNTTSEAIEVNGKMIAPGEIIDDIKDEKVWEKANPIVCSYEEGIEKLRKDVMEAIEAPEKMRNLKTKRLNIWVNSRDFGFMIMEKWAACYAKNLPDIKGKMVISGLDLSSTIDLTSAGFEIPLEDDMYVVLSHSFMPRETILRRIKNDKVRYDLWAADKWITETPGEAVDYQTILDYMEKMYTEFNWFRGEICFDKALAMWLAQQLQAREFIPIEIPQSYMSLSSATKDFRAKAYQKKIIHDGNPLLTWAISNAVTRSGPSENIMLDKAKSRLRIDPIASLINAHVRGMVRETVGGYNVRDMRGFND